MVSHLVNWLSPLKERSTVVTGDRGCFVADTLTADLTFYANGAIDTEWEALRAFRGVAEGDMIRYAIPKREPLLVEHERFRDAVEGEAERHRHAAPGPAHRRGLRGRAGVRRARRDRRVPPLEYRCHRPWRRDCAVCRSGHPVPAAGS